MVMRRAFQARKRVPGSLANSNEVSGMDCVDWFQARKRVPGSLAFMMVCLTGVDYFSFKRASASPAF